MLAKNVITETWHSPQGTWRARFHAIQKKSGFIPSELPAELPEAPKPVAAAVPANAELQNSILNLRKENGDLKAQLANQTTLHENLKRSYGIGAAQVIANVPVSSDYRSPIDKFNEIKDPAEKSRFYDEHRSELSKFITPVQS